MFPFLRWIQMEVCFPGTFEGTSEVECPYCQCTLTVPVPDPFGSEIYDCSECGQTFEYDWETFSATPLN